MNDQKTTMSVLKPLSLAVALATTGSAHALEYDFYGSLRIHGEMVQPDIEAPTGIDSYSGLRDAYSRIGFNVTHKFSDTTTAYGKLEIPFDSANLAVQDPWDQTVDIRVGKVGLKGSLGNIAIGQMWLPYYNAIAYPVDMFSTYYSGFATYTSFRLGDTIAYYSPSYAGFSFSAGVSMDGGSDDVNGNADDRWQATLSYSVGNVTLSGGVDDMGGANDAQIWGGSLMWQATDALYVGAKYEQHVSDLNAGYGEDGDAAMNAYAGYTMGKTTYKAMLADVDKYGEQIIHLGVDHQFSDDLMFFAEYYSEEETAAITTKNGGAAETCWACDGGDVIALGLRYDFGAP